MKVGLVCPYSLDVPGGVQNHVLELAEALLGLGHDVSVLAPADEQATLPPYVVAAGRAVPVPYNGSVARLSFGPASVARVRRWSAAGDFDVLHVHEPTAPSLSLLALATAQVPVVATFHSAMESGSRAMAVVGGMLRPALEHISGQVAVSEHARATMRRHVGGSAVVIPNGLWVDRFAAARPEPDCTSPDGTLLFLGRTDEPRKGLSVLLDALAAVVAARPRVRVLVAGAGDTSDVRTRLPDAVAGSVEVLGRVDDDRRRSLLASADVYVAPHTGGESFGIVLAEAMAAGTAVLASDLPAFAAVLQGRPGEGLGVLFRSGDPGRLAAAALTLLADEAGRRAMVGRAAAAVRRYDWSVVAPQVVRVYEAVTLSAATSGGTVGAG